MRYTGLPIALILTLSACGDKSKNKDDVTPNPNATIFQENVLQSENCLSIEKLQKQLITLNPVSSVITSNVELYSARAIRPNFEKVMALNNLIIDQKPFSELSDSNLFTQTDCEAVKESSDDGIVIEYKIKKNASNHLKFQNSKGEGYEYRLISPQSLLISRTFTMYDVPCRTEKTPILMTVTRNFDWSGNGVPAQLDGQSISKDFLARAAQAVGFELLGIFVSSPGSSAEMIDTAKLRELSQAPPLPEIVSCNGNLTELINPEPDPEEPDSAEVQPPEGSEETSEAPVEASPNIENGNEETGEVIVP